MAVSGDEDDDDGYCDDDDDVDNVDYGDDETIDHLVASFFCKIM